jgi:hypothetical protein
MGVLAAVSYSIGDYSSSMINSRYHLVIDTYSVRRVVVDRFSIMIPVSMSLGNTIKIAGTSFILAGIVLLRLA